MVNKILAEELTGKITLGGAKTFDKVLYLYLSPDRKYLLYSNSATALINHPEVKKPPYSVFQGNFLFSSKWCNTNTLHYIPRSL